MAIIFAVTTAICAFGWLIDHIESYAFVTYIIKKGYTPPNKVQMEACRKYVIENIIRDLFRKD